MELRNYQISCREFSLGLSCRWGSGMGGFWISMFGEVNEGGRRGVLMYAERNLRGLPALSLPPKDENLKR